MYREDHHLEFEKKTGLTLGKPLPIRRGVVYNIQDHSGRVVKIDKCVSDVNKFMLLLNRLNRLRVVPTVRLFQYGKMSKGYYYYVMSRLTPISDPEFMKFAESLFYWRKTGHIWTPEFNWRDPRIPPKTRTFLYQAKTLSDKYGYRYGDLHNGNIMRTRNGEYKYIDLESFV